MAPSRKLRVWVSLALSASASLAYVGWRSKGRSPGTPSPPGNNPATGLGYSAALGDPREEEKERRVQADRLLDLALEARLGGRQTDYLAILDVLTLDGFPTDIRSQAHRLLGQAAVDSGDSRAAQHHFDAVLDMVASGDVGGPVGANSAASALNQLYVMRLGARDPSGALEANSAILALGRDALAPETWAITNHHQAVALAQLGRVQEAIPFAKEAADAFQALGDQGWQASILQEMATLRAREGDNAGALRDLLAAWDITSRENFTGTRAASGASVAVDLYNSIRTAGDQAGAMSFARDALIRFESWTPQRRSADEALNSVEQTLLSSLSGSTSFGRPDLALWALAKIESRSSGNAAVLDSVRLQRKAIELSLSEQAARSSPGGR